MSYLVLPERIGILVCNIDRLNFGGISSNESGKRELLFHNQALKFEKKCTYHKIEIVFVTHCPQTFFFLIILFLRNTSLSLPITVIKYTRLDPSGDILSDAFRKLHTLVNEIDKT